MESITALNEGMKKFKGNMIFTSHDHELTQTVANKIIDLKDTVAKELELSRANKVIGNSLDALVIIDAKSDYHFLNENKDLLRDVLIVSQLEINHLTSKSKSFDKENKEMKIKVVHAKGEKCDRCWQYSEELEDGLCPRCKKILGK